jgi:Phytanoyl-CoA dioxygenase (PhyH)
LAKDEEEFICGWHVDDFGFWPATATSPGINAWIALDDMPSVIGGGFALAVGSHNTSWRQEAHYVTGATTTYPPDGFQSAADMFANRPGSGTCNIQTAAPHLFKRMEETKRIYDLQRGDIIFHQRWLFHRTVAFERDYITNEAQRLVFRRYSVRYAPGSAVIPPGWGSELSVLWDERNGNRTADEVSDHDGPWYPAVWPSPNTKEILELKDLVEKKLPSAQERKLLRQKEMQPFLKQAAARQRESGRQ